MAESCSESRVCGRDVGVSVMRVVVMAMVFVVSSEEVSLQHLADPKRSVEPKGSSSRLEKITYQLATGQARTVGSDSQSRCIRYAVYHIPFMLHSQR